MKIFLLIAAMICCLSSLQSQGGGSSLISGTPLGSDNVKSTYQNVPDEVKKKMAIFFEDLIGGDIKEGYNRLLENSPIKRKKQNLNSLIEKTKLSVDLYGSMFDYEPVSVEMATTSYFKVRFISLHTKIPMRWIFTYYKSPDKGWIITNILYDDQTENLFYLND